MTEEEFKAFFQPFFQFTREFAGETDDPAALQRLITGLKERYEFIVGNGLEGNTIRSDFAGRFFLVFQNANDFCRFFMITLLETPSSLGPSYAELGLFKSDLNALKKSNAERFERYATLVEKSLGQPLKAFIQSGC